MSVEEKDDIAGEGGETEQEAVNSGVKGRSRLIFGIGVGMIIISSIRYYLPFHIYFLDISMKQKLIFAGITIGVAELLFWAGIFIVGRSFVKKLWCRYNPIEYFRKKK